VTMADALHFAQGRLYISREIYDQYFSQAETVILFRQEKDLFVIPVQNIASGGYIVKMRNAAGDRVINGADFFRENGVDDDIVWAGEFSWCETYGGVRLYGFPLM